MSDSLGAGGGAPLGRGRGALIKMLQEQQKLQLSMVSTHSSIATASSSGGSHSLTTSSTIDSGHGTAGPSLGRGRLLSQFTSLSLSSSSGPSTSVSSSVSHEVVAPSRPPSALPTVSGRGKMLQLLQSMRQAQLSPMTEQSSQPATDPTAPGLQSTTDNDTLKAAQPAAAVAAEDRPEEPVVIRRGTKGTPVRIATNYIRLATDPQKGVFEYEVCYSPNVHASSLRHSLLNQHRDGCIGKTKTFDGVTLYLPHRLPDAVTELQSTNENDQSTVVVQLIFKRVRRIADCLHLYNVLFDRIMRQMNYVRFGRKRFDPTAPAVIPQHKLEVWPGYVTAVDEYEDGVMLCLDVSHRVLCQRTVLDLMREAYASDAGGFQLAVQQALLGAVVLTRYNNRTYRVDDIKFDASPMDTFLMNDKEVTYVEYYKSHYNLTIRDTKQPLLIHTEDRTIIGQAEKQRVTFCLIPELCNLTGLTDTMRSDFRLMRDIATITRVTPNQRMSALAKYCKEVNGNAETRALLEGWGLRLQGEPLQMQARQLDTEQVSFGKQRQFDAGAQADFGKYATTNEALKVVSLSNWLVVYTRNDAKFADKFIECMERNSRPMGIAVSRPTVEVLDTDKTELWVRVLRRCIDTQLQIIVLICPTSRDDRYAAIKKVCCAELPIPSQVINARTLANDAKNRAIVQKIALQMNCKLGGALWSVRIPFVNVMICGVDTYHDPAHKADSVAALVASLNSTFTEWFSQPVLQRKKEELSNGLCAALIAALQVYKKKNERLPDKVIMYRDGVGDGQLRMCQEYEVPQMEAAFGQLEPGYKPMLTFVVVQKRINTRVFAMQGNRGLSDLENPKPGCVLDHTITRRHLYDFFLVPQSVRQGTVSPTHYIVVHDTANFAPDILQRLSYKLCFLYYNWPGTVRVPACCQYAHKLAFLVGQSVRRPTAECLATKLFYL